MLDLHTTRYTDGARGVYQHKFGKQTKKRYKRIAKELYYPVECLNEIDNATSERECETILTKYRLRGKL